MKVWEDKPVAPVAFALPLPLPFPLAAAAAAAGVVAPIRVLDTILNASVLRKGLVSHMGYP
jgi:hypothetical protein